MASVPTVDTALPCPSTVARTPDAWAEVRANIQGWFQGFMPYWKLSLPAWADWAMVQVAWLPGETPNIAFPDPYADKPEKISTGADGMRRPTPRAYASQWEDPAKHDEPAYHLTAHQHVSRLAMLPEARDGFVDACAPLFALLDARCTTPAPIRFQIRREATHFTWNLSLARWDHGIQRWVDAGKPRPELGLETKHLHGQTSLTKG